MFFSFGCARQEQPLVAVDTPRLVSIARDAVRKNRPEEDLTPYDQYQLRYVDGIWSQPGSNVFVTFYSRKVIDIEQETDYRVYKQWTFNVQMTPDGNVESVSKSTVAIGSKDPNYLANNGFEFIGTNAPKTQP